MVISPDPILGSLVLVSFSQALTLSLSGGIGLVVETDLVLSGATGDVDVVVPDDLALVAATLVGLLGESVSVVAGKNGSLLVRVNGKVLLTVPPHSDYEAWSIVGPGKELVVCGPGGEIGRWSGVS